MGFGACRRIEHRGRLFVQELGVFRIDDEPAKLGGEGLDEANVVDETSEEPGFGYPVVTCLGRVGDEITALEALLERARMSAGRSAGAGSKNE